MCFGPWVEHSPREEPKVGDGRCEGTPALGSRLDVSGGKEDEAGRSVDVDLAGGTPRSGRPALRFQLMSATADSLTNVRAGAASMRGVVRTGTERVEVVELPRPALEPGTAIVRVRACGICGTDVHDYRFKDG